LKRLLFSLATFAVGFALACFLVPIRPEDWGLALVGSLPGFVPLILIVVSVIWFMVQRARRWTHGKVFVDKG
jgi:hypothetical protein